MKEACGHPIPFYFISRVQRLQLVLSRYELSFPAEYSAGVIVLWDFLCGSLGKGQYTDRVIRAGSIGSCSNGLLPAPMNENESFRSLLPSIIGASSTTFFLSSIRESRHVVVFTSDNQPSSQMQPKRLSSSILCGTWIPQRLKVTLACPR